MVPETALLRLPQDVTKSDNVSNATPYTKLSIFTRLNNLLASRIASPILQIPAAPLKQVRMAGYSGTPLAQKLGIKPAMTITVINEPANYRQLLGEGADGVEFSDRTRTDSSFVHLFTTRRSELEKQLSQLRKKIPDTATIWVSWPKKSARAPTDVTEDVIRAVALPLGFVDVKVCAIDETWSGLKLMIRREQRKSKALTSRFASSSGSRRGGSPRGLR
jgi:hypothetical protein